MSFVNNILSKSTVGALAVGAVVALSSVQADAATIRIQDLSGGDPDFVVADTGALTQAFANVTIGGVSVSVTATPNEDPSTSFLNTISVTTNGVGHIRITTSEDGYGEGAAAPKMSQLAFSVSATRLGENGLTAAAYVDDSNALEGMADQVGSTLTLPGPFAPPGAVADTTTDTALLNDPFSMTSWFEIKHESANDTTSFDATVLAAVPLPAAGFLLLGGLGGLAALRRKRKKAA